MIALIGAVFAASLVGSPHCVGMCGGFLCFVAGQADGRRLAPQVAYHVGRLVSYAVLGAIAGALGAGAERAGLAVGWTRGAALLAGALMVAWGGASLATALGARLPGLGTAPALHRAAAAMLRAVRARRPAERALAMGLVTTLLPCGFLWAFVAAAAGAGSVAGGALVMTAFWAGTVPAMAGAGFLATRVLAPLGRRAPVLTASAVIVIGLLTVAGKLMPHDPAAHVHRVPGAPAPAAHEHGHH